MEDHTWGWRRGKGRAHSGIGPGSARGWPVTCRPGMFTVLTPRTNRQPTRAMRDFQPFEMERWQSTYEYVVDYNLSESGVHPLTVAELCSLAGGADVSGILLGYGQSNGSALLRERIARLYDGATVDNISVTNGSAEANFAALWTLVGPGDEVAVVAPTYMQTAGLSANFGARVQEIPLREENGWQPDPDDITRTVTSRTRLVVVTNPSNPTGAVLGSEARKAIIAAIERTGAWLLADEVYTGAELDPGAETRSFFGTAERVIATGSLSKAYGLPGLRIGWAVGAPDTAEELWSRTDYTTISPGALTDRLAAVALEPGTRERLRARTREYIHAGLDILEEWMRSAGGFSWRRPDAGAICWARYELPVNSSELAERLRVDHSVLIVPGDQFGRDGFIRFGFGLPADELRTALARTADCLDSLQTSSAAG